MRISPFVRNVRRYTHRLGGLSGGGVVAVSGGADSVALLNSLLALQRDPAASLTVAHFNHQLRGDESEADETFVRNLFDRLRETGVTGLTLHCERLDVAGQKGNLEATARRLRYERLTAAAAVTGASWVATGHTADDQAETVLHRLLRGAGLQGLRGIAPRRTLAPGVELVRPLLATRRAEVLAYLLELGQSYCTDRTNDDRRFTRNRLRHELLPLLASQYNPGVVDVLGRLAEQATAAHHFETELAGQLLHEAERPRAGPALVFDRLRLTEASRHLVRALFRLVWAREGWPVGRMGFTDWDRLAGAALGEEDVDLPGRVKVVCRPRVVRVERREA